MHFATVVRARAPTHTQLDSNRYPLMRRLGMLGPGKIAALVAFLWAVCIAVVVLFVPVGGDEPLFSIGGFGSVGLLAIPVAITGIALAVDGQGYCYPIRIVAAILMVLVSTLGAVSLLGLFFVPATVAAVISAVQTGHRARE